MGDNNTINENSDGNIHNLVDNQSIDIAENNQSDVTNKNDDKPWQFKKGNPGGPGRPIGSVSPITKLKQNFQEDPEDFEKFVKEYRENANNQKHIVEMIDGSPIKKIAGDEKNPLRIITLDKELAELYGISTSKSEDNSIEPEKI